MSDTEARKVDLAIMQTAITLLESRGVPECQLIEAVMYAHQLYPEDNVDQLASKAALRLTPAMGRA